MPPRPGTDGEIPVTEYIARYEPAIQRLIREVRRVARTVAPKAEEKAYSGWPIRMRTDRGMIAVAGQRGYVRVNFGRGRSLVDPQERLEGTGKDLRHVKIHTVDEARDPYVRGLIEQELAGGPKPRVTEAERGRILARVRKIALALPETTEKLSHGTPSWFYRDKKLFAQVWAYHHEDGRFAMWCAAPSGAQAALVKADPDTFFVPPYVGHRGWLGVMLDGKLDRDELERIVRDAYAEVSASR